MSLRFHVYFTDGSYAELLVVGGNSVTGKVETIVTDAVDSETNTIPLTQSAYSGEYYISGKDMNNFTESADRNNVTTIFLPGYSPAPNTVSVIVCHTSNGETTCTQRRIMVL